MNNMKQFVLIDGNAIGYAQQLGMTRLSIGDQATHAIYGFLIALRKVAMPNSNERIPIVLWDGSAAWRKEICPDYKANRRNDPKKIAVKDEYGTQVPFRRTTTTPGLGSRTRGRRKRSRCSGAVIDP